MGEGDLTTTIKTTLDKYDPRGTGPVCRPVVRRVACFVSAPTKIPARRGPPADASHICSTIFRRICQDRGMPYEPVPGPIRPFHEDENFYQFRFFCDSDRRVLIEKTLPKSNPSHFCRCGAVISVETDGEGPYLRFGTRPESHLAARSTLR